MEESVSHYKNMWLLRLPLHSQLSISNGEKGALIEGRGSLFNPRQSVREKERGKEKKTEDSTDMKSVHGKMETVFILQHILDRQINRYLAIRSLGSHLESLPRKAYLRVKEGLI